MRKKKLLSIVLCIAVVIGMIPVSAFAKSSSSEGTSSGLSFTDVESGAYYYEPVVWAVQKGVTSGTSDTTFSPDDICTRGQVVTFLWRSAGKPEPASSDNPFKDVKADAYYYKAVLWAVEKGITSGISSTEFGPEDACTRAQVVTFQWRSSGKPDSSSVDNPFTDVQADAYYFNSVLWAVGKKITSGVSETRFAPDDACTRGQIVTFLFRQNKEESLDIEIGDIVIFGSYEQDNDLTNGKEPIEWIVLQKENGEALLLSKYGLDCQPYNETYTDVTWETCTLRTWLNSTFLNAAFSSSELSQIPTTQVQNPDAYRGYDSNGNWVVNNTEAGITDLRYHASGGNLTNDKVFLLSIDEAKSLLGYDSKTFTDTDGDRHTEYPNMQASVTAYAKAKGAYTSSLFKTAEGNACCGWWLRSPGFCSIVASNVGYDGFVDHGHDVYHDINAVRPALWANLES